MIWSIVKGSYPYLNGKTFLDMDTFRTNTPALILQKAEEGDKSDQANSIRANRNLFVAGYGQEQMDYFDNTGLVPENIDPAFVGGTFYWDPARRKREVFPGPANSPGLTDGNLPIPGVLLEATSTDLKPMMDKLDEIIYLLKNR